MSELQVFAFFVLPVLIVAFGGVVYLIEMRRLPRPANDEPDLFEAKPRVMANREGIPRSTYKSSKR